MKRLILKRYKRFNKQSLSLFVPAVLCLATFSSSAVLAEKIGGNDNTPSHISNSYGNTDSLTGNTLQITDETTGLDYVYGAYSEKSNSVIASNNRITVKNSVLKAILGVLTSTRTDSENTSAETNENKIEVSGITITASDNSGILGSYIDVQTTSGEASAKAKNNALIVSNSEITAYIGGSESYAESNNGNSTAITTGNNVTVSDSTIDGDILGSSSSAKSSSGKAIAEASNNRVEVFGKSTEVTGNIYGGSAEAEGGNALAAANNNYMILSDSIVGGEIFGGESRVNLADGSTTVTANSNNVNIVASKISYTIYGGFTSSSATGNITAEAIENTVNVSNSTANDEVYGATSEIKSDSGNITAQINNNTVNVSNSTANYEVYGAASEIESDSGNITAQINNNIVTISNESAIKLNIFGGDAYIKSVSGKIHATANGNRVILSGKSTVAGKIYGGRSYASSQEKIANASANNNTVILSGVSVADKSVYGGYAESSSAGGSSSAAANGNHVTVSSGSKVGKIIYGGFADINYHADAEASNNTILIDDATVGNRTTQIAGGAVIDDATVGNHDTQIVGGAIYDRSQSKDNKHTAIGNTVKLTGTYTIYEGTSLYGGHYEGKSLDGETDLFSGNTLIMDARKVNKTTVAKVANFETININAGNVGNGDVVLKAADGVTLGNGSGKGTTVNLLSVGNASLEAGDRLILMSNVEGDLANDGKEQFVCQEGSFAVGYNTRIQKEQGFDGIDWVSARIQGKQLNPETKVLSESRAAGLAFINTGTDLLVDTKAKGVFGAIRGGHTRYNTGSSVEVDGVNLIAGATKTFAGTASEITAGFFIEGGWGDTATHNTIGGKKLKGEGDSRYYGAGILGRFEKTQGMLRGAYAEGSFRGGRLSDDYTNKDAVTASGQSMGCDIDSTYFAAHAGVGYQWNLTETLRADTSVRYLWTHVQGKTVQTLGDTYKFDAMNSHRVRAGVRFDYLAQEAYTPYIGIAWEYEFDGKAKGSIQNFRLDSADLGGSSGVVNMGVQFKPEATTPLTVDAGFVGYVGQHKGIAGQIRAKYAF